MTGLALLTAIDNALSGDAALTALVPATAIALAGTRAFVVPSIEYLFIGGSPQAELTQPVGVQFDFNFRDMDDLETAIERVRALVSRPYLPFTLGGMTLWGIPSTPQPKPGSEVEYLSWMFDVNYELLLDPADKY